MLSQQNKSTWYIDNRCQMYITKSIEKLESLYLNHFALYDVFSVEFCSKIQKEEKIFENLKPYCQKSKYKSRHCFGGSVTLN